MPRSTSARRMAPSSMPEPESAVGLAQPADLGLGERDGDVLARVLAARGDRGVAQAHVDPAAVAAGRAAEHRLVADPPHQPSCSGGPAASTLMRRSSARSRMVSSPIWSSPRAAATKRALATSRLTSRGHAAGLLVHGPRRPLGEDAPVGAGHAGAVGDVEVNLLGGHRAEVVAHHHPLGHLGQALDVAGQLGLAEQHDRRARARRPGWSAGAPRRGRAGRGAGPRRSRGPSAGPRPADSASRARTRPASRAADPPAGSAPIAGQRRRQQRRGRAGRVGDLGDGEALAVEGAAQGLRRAGSCRSRSPP